MDIDKGSFQSNLELLQKCSSIAVNEDMSDKIMFHENGIGNISRGRMFTFLTCEVGVEGVFLIDNILKIVKAMTGDTISLDYSDDELKISSKSKTRLGFKPIQIENWKSKYIDKPFKYLEGKQPDFKPLPKEFITGLQAVVQCASNSKNLSILNSVAVIGDHLIATDNFKIGHYLITSKFKTHFLIDEYNIQPIIEFNPASYYLDADRILFERQSETGGTDTMICAINPIGKYPDFLPMLKKSEHEGFKISLPEELKELVYIAQQIPGKNEESKIQLAIGRNKLALSYNTINGWFKKNLRIEYDKIPFVINMNINTLSNGLKDIGTDIYISKEETGMMRLHAFTYVFPIEII